MARKITAGIDIGSHHVKVVIAESIPSRQQTLPVIIGSGFAQSRGLRHGYIINQSDTSRSIVSAVRQAEKVAGVRIKRAYLSVGGVGLDEIHSQAEVTITRADSEVTDLDIDRVLAESEKRIRNQIVNRKMLHAIPLTYRIDGEPVLGRPRGMKGTKLSIETLFITCLEQHLNDLIQAVEVTNIEVEDVMAAPLAASFVTLTQAQKIAGCVLANIGAETVSIVVFENNVPQSLKIFPIGSRNITHDIALGLRISPEEAEQVKLGAITGTNVSKKQLEDIVAGRLRDIFQLIEAHLKKIGKNKLLPAGIILTGGGTGLSTIEDLARASLHLPARTTSLINAGVDRSLIKDASWAVAYGLCIWGNTQKAESNSLHLARKTGSTVLQWLKQFLP